MPEPLLSELATFADDTLLLCKHTRVQNAVYNLQEATDCLTAWFYKWRLSLNPQKTEAKIFSLRRFSNYNLPELHISQLPIPWTPKDQGVRYLGLYFDTKLTWQLHVKTKLTQAHHRLTLLYPLLNRKSPLKHSLSSLLYKSLIRPILTYSCPVWFGASNKTIKRLETFENRILRMILNAPWFVRNQQIRRELGVEPISFHIQDLTYKHHERLPLSSGAATFRLGAVTQRRLKPRLYQHILL